MNSPQHGQLQQQQLLQPPPPPPPQQQQAPLAEKVARALRVLYSRQMVSREDRSAADRFLQQFQLDQQAWGIVDHFLRKPDLPLEWYYFCANTLVSKVQRQFEQIRGADGRRAFRASLLQHLMHFRAADQSMRTALSRCMGMVVVHLIGRGEWANALDNVCQQMRGQENALIFLDLLTAIPDAVRDSKLRVLADHRAAALAALRDFGDRTLQILKAFLASAGQNHQLQLKVFRCFLSWVNGSGFPPDSLQHNPLFKATFDALQVPELLPTCCDIIVELISSTSHVEKHLELVRLLIENVTAQRPLIERYISQGQNGAVLKLAQMFAELGDRYINFVVDGSRSAKSLVEVMLMCAAYPHSKHVPERTFVFFFTLANCLLNSHNQNDDGEGYAMSARELMEQQAKPAVNPKLLQIFGPIFMQLVVSLFAVLRFPNNFDELDPEEVEQEKEHRYHAADLLKDCARVVGHDRITALIHDRIKQQFPAFTQNKNNWQDLESSLYMIRSLASRIPDNEDKLVPTLLKSLPSLVGQKQIQYTTVLIVGRYGPWIRHHPEFTAPCIKYVVDHFNDPETQPAAAKALRHLLEACAPEIVRLKLTKSLLDIHSKSTRLKFIEREELMKGMAVMVSCLPPEDVQLGLTRLMEPLVAVMKQWALANAGGDRHDLPDALYLLSTMILSLEPDSRQEAPPLLQAMVNNMKQLWPLWVKLFELTSRNDDAQEALCKVFVNCVRVCQFQFYPLARDLINLCVQQYQNRPAGSLLFAIGTCARYYHQAPDLQAVIEKLLPVLCRPVFELVNSDAAFLEHQALVEDFFVLYSRFLRNWNIRVLQNNLTPQVFALGIRGLGCLQYSVTASISGFLHQMLLQPSRIQEGLPDLGEAERRQWLELVGGLLRQHGQLLVNQLLRTVISTSQSKVLNMCVAPIITALFRLSAQTTVGLFWQGLGQLRETELVSREQFLNNLGRFHAQHNQLFQALKDYNEGYRQQHGV